MRGENTAVAVHESEFGIAHVTIQFECESCEDDERVVCTQVAPRSREPVSTSGT